MSRDVGGDEGQAAVELALVLPFVALLALAVVQVALVGRDAVLVVHAAREAARAAAVDDDAEAAADAAAATSGLARGRLDVMTDGRGGPGSRVRATVRYRAATDVPMIGALVGDVSLTAAASMRVEH